MDISDSDLGEILPEEIPAFEQWTACDHAGAAKEIDSIVQELLSTSQDRAEQLFVRLVEMSFDSCCPEIQLLALGVAAGARVLAHRKAGDSNLSGLWLARTQNAQRLLSEL